MNDYHQESLSLQLLEVGSYILIFLGLANRFSVIHALVISEDRSDSQGFMSTFQWCHCLMRKKKRRIP